jgi:carbon-monoxide dehydrogenase medium subunit
MDLLLNPMNLIADLHGSKDYRPHLVNVMTSRAVAARM